MNAWKITIICSKDIPHCSIFFFNHDILIETAKNNFSRKISGGLDAKMRAVVNWLTIPFSLDYKVLAFIYLMNEDSAAHGIMRNIV